MSTSRFALLTPKAVSARPERSLVLKPGEDWRWILSERRDRSAPLALDFETRGDWGGLKQQTYPVGVALADARGSVYIPFPDTGPREAPSRVYYELMHALRDERVPLLCHNAFFDCGWPQRDLGIKLVEQTVCTYAAYKLLATEGWLGQLWGLKEAQRDLLKWPETNETELDTWLVGAGLIANVSKAPKPGYYATTHGKDGFPRWASPLKSEMWRAPYEVLGRYACLDADSTWQVWTHVLQPALQRFPVLRTYLLEWYPKYTELLIRQRIRGIQIDVKQMQEYENETQDQIRLATKALRELPDVQPFVATLNATALEEVARAEPRYSAPPKPLGPEPPARTRSGKPSPRHAAWAAKAARLAELAALNGGKGPASAKWLVWRKRMDAVEAQVASGALFNPGSPEQKRRLLYEHLKFPVESTTESGLPSTDEDALKGMGPVGAGYLAIQGVEKVRQFCAQTLGLVDSDGIIRPGFRVPATITGRLGGREPNVQQMPGDRKFLSCWRARPGYKLVCCDVVSLENFVLAELSRDPSLLKLYGPDATRQFSLVTEAAEKSGYKWKIEGDELIIYE